jgi:hypothetical protein
VMTLRHATGSIYFERTRLCSTAPDRCPFLHAATCCGSPSHPCCARWVVPAPVARCRPPARRCVGSGSRAAG